MNVPDVIRAIQKELGVDVDGNAGTDTWEAIYNRIVPKAQQPKTNAALDATVSARSEKVIATLLPEVRPYARALVSKAAADGIKIEVISGLRTYEEQDELFKKRPKVTNARGGFSNHNFGIAFDIGVFEGTKYLDESPKYKAVGVLGMDLGLEWGGNWKTIQDEPHFQLRPKWAADESERDMLAELRSRKESGEGAFA
ncbi:MAG: M15 family metallopeptidase [Spartobacteria bacterium]